MMVCIFSYAYWPFLYLFQRNMYSNILPIFKVSCLFIIENFSGYKSLINSFIFQIFSPILWVFFHFLDIIFCSINIFNLDVIHLSFFPPRCYNWCLIVYILLKGGLGMAEYHAPIVSGTCNKINTFYK